VKAHGKGANKQTVAPNSNVKTASFKQNDVTYNMKINSAGENKYEIEKPKVSADGDYTISDGGKPVAGQPIQAADGTKGLKYQLDNNTTRTYFYKDKPSNPTSVKELKTVGNKYISTDFNLLKGTSTEITQFAKDIKSDTKQEFRPLMVRFIDASGKISVLRSVNAGEYEIIHLDANQKVLDAKRVKDSDKDIYIAIGEMCK
jgi:hypothetical protein